MDTSVKGQIEYRVNRKRGSMEEARKTKRVLFLPFTA